MTISYRNGKSDLTKTCNVCGKEFKYIESEDRENNELIPHKIRKVVNDGAVSVPFFGIPPDKRRLIDDKFIAFECETCRTKV